MSPIVYAVPVFMVTILLEAWIAHRRSPRQDGNGTYSVADAVTSLHFGIVSQVMIAFTWLFTFGFYLFAFEHLRLVTLSRNEWWVWVLALVVYDFCYYWAHRCGHEVNLMWASHQVHHSSEYFNLTTALRQTATGAFTAWPFYVLMAVMGIPPFVFAVVALIDLLYQYWVHTELVPKLGFIEKIFVTPSNHRVHHGQNDYCIDRNYGGVFIFWDRLFGTFAEERDDDKVIYGIRTPLASFNPVWGNLKGYRDIWRQARMANSWREGLRVWFGPPKGSNGCIPRRYEPRTRRSTARYALVQYALLIAPATHFIAVGPGLPMIERIGYASFLVVWVVSVGRLLEERAGSTRLEALRVVATTALFISLSQWFGWTIPLESKAVVAATAAVNLWMLARR